MGLGDAQVVQYRHGVLGVAGDVVRLPVVGLVAVSVAPGVHHHNLEVAFEGVNVARLIPGAQVVALAVLEYDRRPGPLHVVVDAYPLICSVWHLRLLPNGLQTR